MSVFGAFAEAERLYRQQFSHENGRLVFRRYQKGSAIPITEDEAEQAVRSFRARQLIVSVASFALLIAVFAGAVAWKPGFTETDGAMWLLILPFLAAFIAGYMWAWTSPLRHLERRTPVASEIPRETLRKRLLAERTFIELIGLGAAAVVIAGVQVEHWPPRTVDDWMWLAVGVFVACTAALSVWRKWQLERDEQS